MTYSTPTRIMYGALAAFAMALFFLFAEGGANCNATFRWGQAFLIAVTALIFYAPLWCLLAASAAWFVWREGRSVKDSLRSRRLAAFAIVCISIIALIVGLNWPCVRISL